MNILVTGSHGQLGSEISSLAPDFESMNFYFTDVDTLDITQKNDIEQFVYKHKIELIVNCAAYTAVDKAEDEPDKAELINTFAVKNLVEICKSNTIPLIHVSTDYVFDGSKNTPYAEEETPNPNSSYGLSKLKGEQLIQDAEMDWMIIRTSWLYSSYGNNFVKTILRIGEANDEIKVVFDQIGTPTWANHLAMAMLTIIQKIKKKELPFVSGIYHFSNQGVCSWYDFAIEILKTKQIKCNVKPVLSLEFPTKAARPFYSVLNKQKICNTYGIRIPHWTEGLAACLEKI